MIPVLLYKDIRKIPDIFNEVDIEKMLYTIEISKEYPKEELGLWLKTRDKTILMTIYLLALRPKEACCLKFEDFNIKDLTLKIRGENNKERKDRLLPIPQILLNVFKEFFSFNRERFWKGSKYLFPSLQNEFLSPSRWKTIMREKILKKANLWSSERFKTRSYTLRHTKATELLNKTKDIFLVANILGHSKLNSTNVYLHKSEDYIEYERKALNSCKDNIS